MDKREVKKSSSVKVTSSYLMNNPTQKEIQKLQEEVQHILLSNIHLSTIQSR